MRLGYMSEAGFIIGVDPGKTTGLCLYDGDKFIYGKEAESLHEVGVFLCAYGNVVVAEDFIVSRRPSEAKLPLKVLGVVEYICHVGGFSLHIQSPSILKAMLPRVKQLSTSPHIRSACAHVEYYLAGLRDATKSKAQ